MHRLCATLILFALESDSSMSQPIVISDLPSAALSLGNPQAEYLPPRIKPWVVGSVVMVLGLGALALATFNALDGDSEAWLGALLGIGLLAGAGWQFWTAVRSQNQRVVVLDKGVVRIDGAKTDIILWDDITGVYQAITVHYTNGIKTGTTHVYTVWKSDKTRVVFNDTFKNVQALGDTIQREATQRLMPRYANAYNSGGTVTFNQLSLSKAGIGNGKESIPWDQVEGVNFNRGQITVRKLGSRGNWARQSAAATPNLTIFLNLVDQIVGVNQRRH